MSTLIGTSGDDTLTGTAGDDTFIGLGGRDTAQIGAATGSALFSLNAQNQWVVSSTQSTDTLDRIEQFQFTDGTVRPGTEFRVNTTTSGYQQSAVVAALADGGWVVAWASSLGTGASAVYSQRYTAAGVPAGPETLLSTTINGSPSVAGLAGGGYVISWSTLAVDGTWDIHAQRFDAGGAAAGAEALVNTTTYGSQLQTDQAVTEMNDGGYLITWQSLPDEFGYCHVYSQRFDAVGNRVGGELIVEGMPNYVHDSVTTNVLSGGWVVTWMFENILYQRRYDAGGQPAGDGAKQFVADLGFAPGDHHVAALWDGGWIIAYVNGLDIYTQRFDANGAAVGGPALANSSTAGVETLPSITALPDGGWVVTWQSRPTSTFDADIYAQRFDATGAKVGAETLVTTVQSGNQFSPDVAGLTDGQYMITWTTTASDGSTDVHAVRFDSSGTPVSSGQSLAGDDLANTLSFSGPQAVELIGGGGNDTLQGGGGSDTLDGGDGFDTARIADASSTVTWQFTADRDLRITSPNGGTDTLVSIEQVQAGASTVAIGFGGVADWQLPDKGFVNETPRVAVLGDGGFVATWAAGFIANTPRGTTQMSVYTQLFDANGVPVGAETLVAGPLTFGSVLPTVTALAGGGWVVSWRSGADGGSVLVQQYDAAGSAVGTPALVNSSPAGFSQAGAEVLALADGGYVVAWTAPDGSASGIYTQRFDAAGGKVGGATLVNTTGTTDTAEGASEQTEPAVALTGDGGYVVVWTSGSIVFGSASAVVMQRFDASGTPIGGETVLSSNGTLPDVVNVAGGGYLVVWDDGPHIQSQRFDAGGNALGPVTQVDTATPNVGRPAVTAHPDGGWIVSWTAIGAGTTGGDVYAQRFDAAGQRVGGETLVNTVAAGHQIHPDLAALANGSWMVSWTGLPYVAQGADSEVFLQRFDTNGTPDTYLTLTGGVGDDVLRMSSSAERVHLVGGDGNDVLAGAPQTWDVLTGGSGNDTFEFASSGNGQDVITDWARGDLITVAGANFSGSVASGDGSSVGLNGIQSNTVGPLTSLYIGTDATPGADVVIRLVGDFELSDFSISGNTIQWSSVTPPPSSGVVREGGNGRDDLVGTAFADTLRGSNGRDSLTGLAGDDVLDGGNGVDIAIYQGAKSEYTITRTGKDTYTVSGPEGTDTLVDVERLRFSDINFALDDKGNAGQAFRLYQAAFDRQPDLKGLGYQMNALDEGLALGHVAKHFLESPEFQAKYGALDDSAFVTALYQNVLHRNPEAEGLGYHVARLASGVERSDILVGFSESPECQDLLIGLTGGGMLYVL
jgi:hypothetical protein